jgi:hypothetical protein
MISIRLSLYTRQTLILWACLLLSAGSAAARDFTVQTLSDPAINSRLPSISETGLVAWQGYTVNNAGFSMSQRLDVLSSPDAQRSDIFAWKDNEVKNMTMEDTRIVGRSERAKVFANSIVFMAWFRNDQKGGLPFELSNPVKNEDMSQMEDEYPTLFDPPTSALEAEDNAEEPKPEPAAEQKEDEPSSESKLQAQNWRGSGHAADVAVIRPGGNIERITPGTRTFSFPVISEAGIAFQCARGWPYGYEILAWQPDATNLLQITTNYFYVLNPQMDGQDLVFQAWDGNDYEIFRYRFDTELTEQITNNQFDDIYPVVSGGEIAWVAHPTVTAEIFLMRDGVIRKISEGTEDNAFPCIWKGRVVWQGYDDTDLEIYYFNGRRTIKLTSNIWDDMMPKVNNGLIAWMSYVDNWDAEIMALDLSDNIAVQLTDNDAEDSHVETAGEKIVWQAIHDEGGLIQMAVPNAPRPTAIK